MLCPSFTSKQLALLLCAAACLFSPIQGFQIQHPFVLSSFHKKPLGMGTDGSSPELYPTVNDKQLAWDENNGRFFEVTTEDEDGAGTSATVQDETTEATMVESESKMKSGSNVEEYKNLATTVLANFMNKPDEEGDEDQEQEDPLGYIDFNAPKLSKKLDLETLAAVLDAELYEKEWFVTGNVNPIYFADNFRFEDPDVKLDGIENYARGVYKLFDQNTSRAGIISTKVNPDLGPNMITCTWRLSGYARIGPGIKIKPYVVFTDFRVDPESGLIDFQQDRFDIPSWDILLSALFPFLIGKVTSPPAPPVEPRVVPMPNIDGSDEKPSLFAGFEGLPDFGSWFAK